MQKVFTARCVACHGCLESPCQLNLQSHEGLLRGLKYENVYHGSRPSPTAPTRLEEDDQSLEGWRTLGFHDVVGTPENSVLLKVLSLGAQKNYVRPTLTVKKSQVCVSQDKGDFDANPELAMPYGLPPIGAEDVLAIKDWMQKGRPVPEAQSLMASTPEIQSQVSHWTEFLNKPDLKSRIVSRYLFEHYFLAHFYFESAPKEFMRLIRSKNSCDTPLPIATRSPNDDPGIADFKYCFVKIKTAIVAKNHIPYKLSDEKLSWLQNNFFGSAWTAASFPSYEAKAAANPFLTFKDIPIIARYKFLLEDAQYQIMTFVKGPVCSGSIAVNSIQEQFYVLFMNPQSDLMVRSPVYAEAIQKILVMPGVFTEKVSGPIDFYKFNDQMSQNRLVYRQVERDQLQKLSPQGYGLADLWDGNQTNDNALLTVFRHDDNATVLKGARGDLSKTAFVLDYSVFERLVYNLVVNFDVYGNYGHQLLTRLYMDIIRKDAENNYLYFLPPEQRATTKKYWYADKIAQLKLNRQQEFTFPSIGTRVAFQHPAASHQEFMQKVIFEYLHPLVRGPIDSINWKKLGTVTPTLPIELQLKKIAAVAGAQKPFARYFPELSYLMIGSQGQAFTLFSVVHNNERQDMTWSIVNKSRSPDEDTLTLGAGFYGYYPNQFFYVEAENLPTMVREIEALRTEADYVRFQKKYGVDRMSPQMWPLYDFATSQLERLQPAESGAIDLSRYAL